MAARYQRPGTVTLEYGGDDKTGFKFDAPMEVSGYCPIVAGDFLSLRPAINVLVNGEPAFSKLRFRVLNSA